MGFTGAITAVITLIFGFIFVEEIVTKVIELLGMIIDIPTARGTRHLTKEEQSADVEKLHSELVDAYSNFIFVIGLIGNVIGAVLSACMVFGAVKKRRMFLLPWLILGLMVITGTTIALILAIVFLPVSYAITLLIVGLIQILIMMYFWLVVFSFFQELRERDRMELNAPVEMKTRLTATM